LTQPTAKQGSDMRVNVFHATNKEEMRDKIAKRDTLIAERSDHIEVEA
jgi:hypothetical protein